jgi:uncharacterized DUF497 family protein
MARRWAIRSANGLENSLPPAKEGIFSIPMFIEFDPVKSSKNKEKHGIDFVESERLWDDPNAIAFPARSQDEERFALLACYQNKLWVAFYTNRNENIRLISVRRARPGERKLYDESQGLG